MTLNKCLTLSLVSLLLLITHSTVYAEQLAFRKTEKDNSTTFKYRFVDHANKTQALEFTLPNAAMFNRFRKFRGYRPSRVQDTVLMTLKKAAAKVDQRKVAIEFIKRTDSIEIMIKAKDQQLKQNTLESLLALRDKTIAKQARKAYFSYLDSQHGRSGMKPDHVRFAKESRVDVNILSQAIIKANPKLRGRKLTEYILAFIQSIPYSTLESRIRSSGAGFSPPLRVINNNQGDCDSKVTLMAAMMNALYPRLKVVIIYLNNHALIGVQMTHRKTDKWIKLKDREYILAEPTGPAMLPFGKIADTSEIPIDGQQFDWEMF